jgi:curved DNA-binding protein CbpA
MQIGRPDPYVILGVAPDATPREIGQAYRALLRLHHPDTRTPADDAAVTRSDAALQQVLAAYSLLRDPIRRADYDRRHRPSEPASHPHRERPSQQHLQQRHEPPRGERPPIVAGPVRWQPARRS